MTGTRSDPALSDLARPDELLRAVNDTARPLERDDCLHVLFDVQAERSPEAAAVIAGGQAVSYGRLQAWAARVAGRLAAAGVGPGDAVGICGTPSAGVVAGVLGVLRCGAVYVPLEADWPQERLRFMARDCGLQLAACDEEHAALVKRLGLDPVSVREDGDQDAPPPPARDPGDLAYVLYTSGSTGAPKGVAIPHRAVNRLVSGAPDYVDLGPSCRFLWLSPLTFDASVIELWGPLLTGGAIVIMPREQAGLERLAETIRANGVTAALFISPQLHLVVDRDPQELRGLRNVLVGGDVLSPDHVRRLLASGVVDQVVHCYGPTESTLFATVDVVREVRDDESSLPIGRPIANTTCHVVDGQLHPVPVGVAGELLIGGLGLAEGYVNRQVLTAEKFIPDPFAQGESGRRLYRTGDLARWRPDGRLEFLGRIDDQVKIRGYRIELAEIEATLRNHAGVQDCVVLAREDGSGHKRLVAYVVAPERLHAADLRDFVARHLPAYMIPAAWVMLDTLPLTSNNKVDRAALPAPNGGSASGGAGEPPRGGLERRIAELFAEVLRIDDVGRDDGFFELGGDSLLATDVVARLNQHAGVRLPLDVLLDASTPATLAGAVEGAAAARAGHTLPPLVSQPRASTGPLSLSQAQICFLNDLDPDSVAYQFQAIIWLHGSLDRDALAAALNAIVARHEIYRTTFPRRNGDRVAEIHDPFPVTLDVAELTGFADSDHALADLAVEQFQHRIGIERLPLVRWRLAALGPTRHALLHAEHHLVHDGWSMMIFLRELRELYAAAVEARPAKLAEPAIQFTDFAVWQHDLLETDVARAQLEYWRGRLADPPEPLALPYDRPRPARQTFNGDQICFTISPELAARVRGFARERDATAFMTMLAAFVVLLHRLGGAQDVVVGSGLANRRLPEFEDALGMFINTVALRIAVSADLTVSELLERVRGAVLEAHANQDVPFPRVVEAVGPARAASHSPLYQTLFSFADASLPDLRAPGLEIVPDETPGNGSAKAEVNVVVVNHGRPGARMEGELTVVWEYNSDLFSPQAAERMTADYRQLLAELVAEPERRLSHLSLAGRPEGAHVPAQWNDTASRYPRDASIPECFAEAVRRDPEAIAVVSDHASLTYRELDERASQLAAYLRAQDVGPGMRVGIALERSTDMVAALLGTLKTAAAYVPLDPADPAERRDFVLRDAGISLVLDEQLLQDPAVWAGHGADPEEKPVATSDAYVMYTSGSTGEPKGVVVTHRNVVRLVMGQTYADFGPDEVFLQMAPLAFDASTFEIWGALLHGGKLVLHPPGAIDLGELRATLERHQVTTLWLTAALFHQVVDADVAALRGLKQLLAGGDVLLPDRVARAIRELPGVRIINGYGPTEATTFSCCFDATSGVGFEDSVPIGRPIANTYAYVLGHDLEPAPVGVAGELCIGGDGVARGYENRPDLTTARFIADRFGGPGERLYRTGDVARWRADGQLEFLGREDLQVKVRGFRVEPGEVESVLATHPGVREAAVVAPPDQHGDRRLVAHVTAPGVATEDLRAFLSRKLPPYMIPGAFVPVDGLPLTPNGKVDRAALAAAGVPQPVEPATPTVAPPTDIERVVGEIWADVLGLDAVAPEDDFFASGGHSLLALRVIHELNERFGVDLPVRSLLIAPTVAALAAEVDRARGG